MIELRRNNGSHLQEGSCQVRPNGWIFLPGMSLSGLTAAVLILFVSGLVHGFWTQRWGQSRKLEEAAARLAAVPLALGEWQGEAVELDSEAVAHSGLAACWMRTYRHAQRDRQVSVLLMCGRPGPTSVHTPEWCYSGAGYEMTAPPVQQTVTAGDGSLAEFWMARFVKPEAAEPSHLRIFWSWNAAGAWQAPKYPRLTFGRYPALYKLYLIRNESPSEQKSEDDPSLEFMRVLLPELGRVLASSPWQEK